MLVAHSYLKDRSIWKDFLPRLMLLRSNQEKSGFVQDISEMSIGVWHALGKKRPHFFSRPHFMDSLDKRGMSRTIGALAESMIFLHVLFCIVEGHIDEILKRGLRSIALCGQIKLWTGNDIFTLSRLNNGREGRCTFL